MRAPSYPYGVASVSFVLSGPDNGAATLRGDPIASWICDGQVRLVIVSPAGSSLRLTVLLQLTVARSHLGSHWTVAELYLKAWAARAPEKLARRLKKVIFGSRTHG